MSALLSQISATAEVSAGETPLTTRVCRTWEELERLRNDWNKLLSISCSASIFQTPEWLGSWWQAFGAGKDFFGLIFTDAEKNTVGIAPLYMERTRAFGVSFKSLRMVGAGSGDSDALDFITAPGFEQSCAKSFLAWLADEAQWNTCALETMPPDSLVAQHLAQLVRQKGWRMQSETSPNFFIPLPATWPEYLDALEPSFRPLLTRYPKRLQSRYRVRIVRCACLEDLDASLQTLFTLHQMRWTGQGEPGAFASAERCDFYFRMARAFLERGWLEFWRLELEDEAVAAQFCFRYGNTVSLLQEGFNPKYTAEKIGYALRAHVLQEMIRTGANRYDFLGGADTYKLKFGAHEGCYLTLRFAGPSSLGRWYLALQDQKQRTKLWLKRKLPARVLAALRRERSGTPVSAEKKEIME